MGSEGQIFRKGFEWPQNWNNRFRQQLICVIWKTDVFSLHSYDFAFFSYWYTFLSLVKEYLQKFITRSVHLLIVKRPMCLTLEGIFSKFDISTESDQASEHPNRMADSGFSGRANWLFRHLEAVKKR